MLACFQKVLVGKDNAIAFHKALTNFYVGALCVGEVKEKTYQEEFKHLYRNDYSRFIEIMILP